MKTSDEWWCALLDRHGLSHPDGRPVFRYHITDGEFTDAQDIIRRFSNILNAGQAKASLSALFICYCAEFYKREVGSTKLVWEPLLTPVNVGSLQNKMEEVVEPGLRYLQRKLVKRATTSGVTRQWLLTLTLQAGLPVKILSRADGGWLVDYLTQVLAISFQRGSLSENEALSVAYEFQGLLRDSYIDPDFFSLVADLALVLRSLRDRAPIEIARGPALIAWLDLNEPGWRDQLPMVLGDEAASKAIEGLVRNAQEAALQKADAGRFEVVRGIRQRGNGWVPTLRLDIAGSIRLPEADLERGRLELWPIGNLARYAGSALALALPPALKRADWTLKSTMANPFIEGFPHTDDVELQFRGAALHTPKSVEPDKGQGLRGEVLTFEPIDRVGREQAAVFAGSGSVASRAERLFVITSTDAALTKVDEASEGGYSLLGDLGSFAQVYEVTCSVYVTTRGNDNKFRIDPGAEPQNHQLKLHSCHTNGWETLDRAVIVTQAPLDFRIVEAAQARKPNKGEVEWRSSRQETWRCVYVSPPKTGAIRVRWRDKAANVTLDAFKALVVPTKLAIKAQRNGKNLKITNELPENVKFIPDADQAKSISANEFEFVGRPTSKVIGDLLIADSRVRISVNVAPERSTFVRKDGSVLDADSYTWSQISDCEAFSAVKGEQLMLSAIAPRGDPKAISEVIHIPDFDSIVPFARIESVLEQMRSAKGDLDVEVRIAFKSRPQTSITVAYFGPSLISSEGGIVGSELQWAENGEELVFRSLVDFHGEKSAIDTKSFGIGGHAIVFPPVDLKLPALAYLRKGQQVLTRPLLLPSQEVQTPNSLDAVFGISNQNQRKRAIIDWFDRQPLKDAAKTILDTVKTLNGLPATALDILKFAPPKALAAALLRTNINDEAQIWALERQLPFSWLLCPAKAWWDAIESFGGGIFDEMVSVLGPQTAAREAKTALHTRLKALVLREPCLDYVFAYLPDSTWTLMSSEPLPQFEAMGRLQGAIKDYFDAHGRDELDAKVLTYWREMVDFAAIEVVKQVPDLDVADQFLIWTLRQQFPQEFEAVFGRKLLDMKADAKREAYEKVA